MAIVNPDTINKWEMELIESLAAALDVREVRNLFQDKYGLKLRENFESERGRIVALNNRIAYELRFKANCIFSIVIDRLGNFQGFGGTNGQDALNEDRPGSDTMLADPEVVGRKVNELISAIASGLNLDGLGTLFGKKFKLQGLGDPRFESGDLVVLKGRASFRLNFEMAINFSIMVDRYGNFMGFGDFNPPPAAAEKAADAGTPDLAPDDGSKEHITHDQGSEVR